MEYTRCDQELLRLGLKLR